MTPDEKSRITRRRIYLDLDGVMADFDAHYPALFGHSHKELDDEEMWAVINAHPEYFRTMPLTSGAKEFWEDIEHLDPIILTACPKTNYVQAAIQKRQWVYEHLSQDATVLPVLGGRNKFLFMHAPRDILIDDYKKNLEPWAEAGGIGILHRNFSTTLDQLAFLLPDGTFTR